MIEHTRTELSNRYMSGCYNASAGRVSDTVEMANERGGVGIFETA